MTNHKLLTRQLKKYATEELSSNPDFLQFIEAVADSYDAFDRDKELSNHAFAITQQEFTEINDKLKEEVELRRVSIHKLKNTLQHIKAEHYESVTETGDDLLEIVDLLNEEITRRKEVEKQLLLAKEDAEQASLAKSEFLSIISHEIRTPLNAVLGMGHLLLKSNPRPDQIDNLTALKTSADNLLMLINDILDFNKIEAGKLDLEETSFSLKKLVKDLVTANTHSANERENKIVMNFDENLPDHFIGDTLRMGQVLNNLISNAVKFTHRGTISVSLGLKELRQSSAMVEFSIADTGVGISKKNFEAIFLPFMQASTSITRQYGGTGLGLAITKRILSLLGSDVKLKSEIGKGSEFSFTLELKTVEAGETPASEDDAVDFDLNNKSILLVEDTLFNVLYATQLLESWKARVNVAENGAIAVEMMKKNKCDLILMDLQMPVMDGYTATVKIREFDNKTPIIALTASATSDVRKKVMSAGMQDYVTKPFNPNDFFIKLKKYLS
jgi:signal transduction histidine kinase/CheY-like chemotaxis protein